MFSTFKENNGGRVVARPLFFEFHESKKKEKYVPCYLASARLHHMFTG